MSTDEVFEQQIVSHGKMCNLKEVFELEAQIKRVRESVESEVQAKLSREKRKVSYGKFNRQTATAARAPDGMFRRYKGVSEKAERDRKLGERFGLVELDREMGKLNYCIF